MAKQRSSDYHLGYSPDEHERLIRQGARLAPVTERFLREAGIGEGQRVLDLGSGVGDVAMVAAKLVGQSGCVVGIERDPSSVERSRVRAANAGLNNVEFVTAQIDRYSAGEPFDALVGRYVLQFLPDPAATLRSLLQVVRPGGVVAFQEGSWTPFVALSARLPLWSASVSLLHATGISGGVNLEMGLDLHKTFLKAGLPAPAMRLEMELGREPDFTRWVSDSLHSVLPQLEKAGFTHEAIGDLETLQRRLHEEVSNSETVVPWIGLVGAWSRKP